MSESIQLNGGLVVRTGCLVPDKKPETMPAYAATMPTLTMAQIRDVLFDQDRIASRVRFGRNWIGNQGQRSSCNGYAGAKSLQRARVLRGLPRVDLSGEGLYAQINGGRDEGSMLDDGMRCLMEHGVPPEELVPIGTYRWSTVSEEAKAARARFTAPECYRVESELELASALCLGFMGVVAVHVTANFEVRQDGLVGPSEGSGNHAVSVDDAVLRDNGREELLFDMPNSWGTVWGHDGRGYLSWRRHLEASHQYHAFYVIRTTSDDPLAAGGLNPPIPVA